MNPDNATAADDEVFAERLADIDEDLAEGRTPPIMLPERLRRGVAALQVLHQLRHQPLPAPTVVRDDAPTLGAAPPGPAPTQLGRFRIIRELGRGGFGVVFLAHDPRLHRDVALKAPHAGAMIDVDLRERFRREARAAAALDHPNIVPVYEVDEQGPVLMLVSAYCPGITLSEWLSKQTTPVPPADAARLVAELADAVEHAHARGVLHRDLKPANVLLQNADSRFQMDREAPAICDLQSAIPKITDFGLAKLLQETGDATKSGAVLGTPAYMSPEQAQGRGAIDARSDVYALGAMLYEILIGRPPLRGESDVDTLQLVCTTEPIALRQLRPKLPRDLATICMKCLQKEPQQRYAKAAELRDDLERFLAGQPVVARPVGRTARFVRWCRRRPLVASLAACLIAAVGIGGAVFAWEYRRANVERDAAVVAGNRNVRLLGHAGKSLQEMIDLGHVLVHDPATVDSGIEILKVARKHYRDVVGEDPTNADLHHRAAVICRRLALLYAHADRMEESEEARADAVRLYEEMLTADPTNWTLRLELQGVYSSWADSLREKGKSELADACFERSRQLAQSLLDERPNDDEAIKALSNIHFELGDHLRAAKRFAEAETHYLLALELARRQTPALDSRIGVANTLNRLGDVQHRLGRSAEAEASAREALEMAEKLKLEVTSDPRPFEVQATGLVLLGRVLSSLNRYAEAVEAFNRSLQLIGPHVAEVPVARGYFAAYLRASLGLALALQKLDRADDGLASLQKAVEIRPPQKPAAGSPEELWECYAKLVEMRLAAGDVDAARRDLEAAQRRLADESAATQKPNPAATQRLAALAERISAAGK